MSKYKINLFCGDNLEPSSSALNATKHVEWVYDGSGEVNIYGYIVERITYDCQSGVCEPVQKNTYEYDCNKFDPIPIE